MYIKNFVYILAFMVIMITGSGCTMSSIRVESQPVYAGQPTMPVKFKFSTVSWESNQLPPWFSKPHISQFITLLKQRAPSLFSEDDNAIPLTIKFDHKRIMNNNNFYNFLSLCTGFTIIPIENIYKDFFTCYIQVGARKEYVEKFQLELTERQLVSFLPLYVLFIPDPPGSFCRTVVHDSNIPINATGLQDVFLNMIYSLDKNKLQILADGGQNIEQLIRDFNFQLRKIPFVVF